MNSFTKNPVTVCQKDTCVTVSGKWGEVLSTIIVISAGVALLSQVVKLLK